jgi:hypothetical protein
MAGSESKTWHHRLKECRRTSTDCDSEFWQKARGVATEAKAKFFIVGGDESSRLQSGPQDEAFYVRRDT